MVLWSFWCSLVILASGKNSTLLILLLAVFLSGVYCYLLGIAVDPSSFALCKIGLHLFHLLSFLVSVSIVTVISYYDYVTDFAYLPVSGSIFLTTVCIYICLLLLFGGMYTCKGLCSFPFFLF